MSDFNARYTLFPVQEKYSAKSPDVTGNIELLAEEIPSFIEYLQSAERVEDYKGNQIVKIRMSGWDNESKTGKQYQSGFWYPCVYAGRGQGPGATASPVPCGAACDDSSRCGQERGERK